MTVYRLGSSAAVLLAGFALMIGYRAANALDVLIGIVCLLILSGVKEAMPEDRRARERMTTALLRCFGESIAFLRRERRARILMLINAFLGALAVLLGFFLKARLETSPLARGLISPALFAMGLGGVLGSRLALRFARWRMRSVMLLCAAIILLGVALGAMESAVVMVMGGFLAGMCDDILQVSTDARLNALFPSEQRATILSISSLLFSVVMIMLSPMAGWFFGRL